MVWYNQVIVPTSRSAGFLGGLNKLARNFTGLPNRDWSSLYDTVVPPVYCLGNSGLPPTSHWYLATTNLINLAYRSAESALTRSRQMLQLQIRYNKPPLARHCDHLQFACTRATTTTPAHARTHTHTPTSTLDLPPKQRHKRAKCGFNKIHTTDTELVVLQPPPTRRCL
ncbi:hypothetical protein B0T17DRAFT_511866 [Bombardia bombarda]|uniref:Uncharacterized protein n=1 Tax=Bombardia bombarda TaxID=252184 RepID=A0AA39W9T0_9PEZI|nr:hypothetical protein B0T17DRAFT_511866 [Bombardia bombarda]